MQSPTNPTPPAQAFLIGVTSANGVGLWEYIETDDFWGKNSYSGDTASVNETFVGLMFRVGPITATTVAGGFQMWTQPALRPRPAYPTYGNNANINISAQLYPPPTFVDVDGVTRISPLDCNLYTDPNGVHVADTSATGFFVNGFCTASCYTPEEQISFAGGEQSILDAMTAQRTGVTTLTPDSTLDKIRLTTDDVASYTREIHDSTHVIFEVRTASGGLLRVTDKHPVIVGDGRIVEAQSLKVGDKLIKPDGSRDPIASVAKTTHFGKVYNLKPKSTNHVANILVAQGYLVGSSRYQNEDVEYMNRIILGRGIPRDVIPL
ncbi:MAG TPA: Hint domain-containing protein [Kofleriaceae bacterium]|nr:Hint domain-containing protein [Kofleriaceae bacterium]